MRIAVAGGTGVAGREAVAAATAAGHDVVVLSRARGVDARTGSGLAPALDGVGALIDAINIETLNRAKATAFFEETSRNLQHAAESAGVGRIVVLSIVGVDRVPGFGYYAAKLAHERAQEAGPVPVAVLRTTQFDEFGGQVLDRIPGPVALIPDMRIRPVAAATVGRHLVRVATGADLIERSELAGPEEIGLVELAKRTLAARGERRKVLPLPIPGASGKAMRNGALLPGPDAVIDGPGVEEWLSTVAPSEPA